MLLNLCVSTGSAAEDPVASVSSRRAVHALTTAVGAAADGTLVAVGEQGHIMISQDLGQHWISAATPVDVLLTGVCFADNRTAYVVGHDETLLITEDAGFHWRLAHYAPDSRQPLLDVACLPDGSAVAVGAYSTIIRATDHGRHIQSDELKVDIPTTARKPSKMDDDADLDQPHLNAVTVAADGALYVAAEGGRLYRSHDSGDHWTLIPFPYAGSLFTALSLADGGLLVGGLRGHLYRSDDRGVHWDSIDTGTDVMLDGAAQLRDRRVVIVGLAGVVLLSNDEGHHFQLLKMADRKGISGVSATSAGAVIAAENGVHRLLLPNSP
jgi:photosystem II stability/assembly factor-like uncharacterized protein